jgi:PIN domain nuclease of toxin-antitoxin system
VKLLLDTHIWIWWLEGGGRLSPQQRDAIERAGPASPLLLSEISLWEVAMLVSLDRLRLSIPLRDWLERGSAPPLVKLLNLNPAVAAATAELPATFHRDPADRVIVATALLHDAVLLTQDHRILDAGIVRTLS